MSELLLALNAGSSSLKFALIADRGDEFLHVARGLVERVTGDGEPRFVARPPDGTVIAEHTWPRTEHVGHAGALG
jgi:acetate kinase